VFLSPLPLGSFSETYDVRLRFIGTRVVDFILALVELFRWMLRLRRYEGISIENRRFRSNRVSSAENFREKGSTPPTIPLVRKLAWPDLSCGIKMWAQVSSVLSQSSRSTDRQTDRQKGLAMPCVVLNAVAR